MLPSTDPNGGDGDDDDGFIDIDELLAAMKESTSTSMQPNSGGIAKTGENGTLGGSPVGLTVGSTQDSMILSDNQPLATGSETDYSEVDLDLIAKGDPESLQVADSDGFGLGTTFIFGRCVANHQDKDGDSNDVADHTKLRLAADYLRSASLGQSFATHQASRRQLNTDITQGRSLDPKATSEVEDLGIDIFMKDTQDKSNARARSSRRQKVIRYPSEQLNLWQRCFCRQ